MRVEALTLKNVGPFDLLTLPFEKCGGEGRAEIHLLVGENGCGKSTVLYALANLFRNFDSGPQPHDVSSRIRMEEAPAIEAVIDGQTYFERVKKISRGNFAHDAQYPQPVFINGKRSFAVFAYSGACRFENTPVSAEFDPQKGALQFTKAVNLHALRDWLLNSPRGKKSRMELESAFGALGGEDLRIECARGKPLFFVKRGQRVPAEALPGGTQSILCWVADLQMRLGSLDWHGRARPGKRPFLLLLDEIDIHLHPRWQRFFFHFLQRLFPHAQIIASTHSPFAVSSVSAGWVHRFKPDYVTGKAFHAESVPSQEGHTISYVHENLFGLPTEFGVQAESELVAFTLALRKVRAGKGSLEKDVLPLAEILAAKSQELTTMVGFELNQLRRQMEQPKRSRRARRGGRKR